jgi:hypothetical protein
MEKYIQQLLADIAESVINISLPFAEKELALQDWLSPEEEEKLAPVRNLEELTGIRKEQLPPVEMLTDEQAHNLLEALKKMLDADNWVFVMQIEVPERIQYVSLRDNFNQEAKVKQWHMGFFEFCRPGTEHRKCALGEYCHCAIFAELFSGFNDVDLSSKEERTRELEIEIQHLKRKYDKDWMKYYPYHLDAAYDDEKGDLYNYGFDDEDEKKDDNWWRR